MPTGIYERRPFTEAHRQALSVAMAGNRNGQGSKGKKRGPQPQEVIEKRRAYLWGNQNGKGSIRSQEFKDNVSRTKKGRKLSEEHRLKVSAAKMGEKNPNWQGGLESNREHVNLRSCASVHRRMARIKGAKGSFTTKEWRDLKKKSDFRCQLCGKREPEIKLTRDHIIPLIKGGSNFIENIQPLCGICNSKKSNKEPMKHMTELISLEAEGLKRDVISYSRSLMSIQVTNSIEYEQARQVLLAIKDRQKLIKEKLDPIRVKAYDTYQTALNLIKEAEAPLKEAETYLKRQIGGFLTSEELKRKAEENRLRLIAQKEEENRRLAAALQAEAEGDTEEADAILDEEPAFIPPPIVARTVETGGGIAMKTNWKFRINDASKIPREFLAPDLVKIGGYVRSMKEAAKIPGVDTWAEGNIAAGRRS